MRYESFKLRKVAMHFKANALKMHFTLLSSHMRFSSEYFYILIRFQECFVACYPKASIILKLQW